MQRVLRHKESKLFYAGRNLWTHKFAQAKRFSSIRDAAIAVQHAGLRDQVELVVRFEYDPKHDITFEI
jgi:hypothetical protein